MTVPTQTVREIAQNQPSSIRVFEQFGIEYCCGGGQPLEDACAAKDVDIETVIAALEAAAGNQNAEVKDWTRESLENLTNHIATTHHAFCKEELPRLSGLASKVVNVHGGTNPELAVIRGKLADLAEELIDHIAEEEVMVFPMIARLERAGAGDREALAKTHSSIGKPLELLISEHDHAGVLLAEIRGLSQNFIAPEYACSTYHAFYDGLREFERDLHRHVHLENNILFPRALVLDASLSEQRSPQVAR
ncbi:MAG TPA: iron-sulfur cluster repair di-iron protein [Terracidiphilus sp.]|nr:iron-sulfur cluster repair di-iron protein [Terracidiphilus sp.]